MGSRTLPHCDALHERFLAPWFPDASKRTTTRPDLYKIAAYEGEPLHLSEIQYLPLAYLQAARARIAVMQQAARVDYRKVTPFEEFDLAALDAVDRVFDRTLIGALLDRSEPGDWANPYLTVVCSFGSMLGDLFEQYEGFGWLCSYPYFDSIIVHAPTGYGVPVFDWAVKKMSEYGVDDGFAAKVKAALHTIHTDPD